MICDFYIKVNKCNEIVLIKSSSTNLLLGVISKTDFLFSTCLTKLKHYETWTLKNNPVINRHFYNGTFVLLGIFIEVLSAQYIFIPDLFKFICALLYPILEWASNKNEKDIHIH